MLPAHDAARLGVGNAEFLGQDRWIDDYWRYGGRNQHGPPASEPAPSRYLGRDLEQLPPEPTPDDGYYHPGSPSLLTSTRDYERWYEASGR